MRPSKSPSPSSRPTPPTWWLTPSRRQVFWQALLISLTVISVRIAWLFPAASLPRLVSPRLRVRDPYPGWRQVAIVAWVGMRGGLSLAAALALPFTLTNGLPFPQRDLVIFFTFGVILVTLVGQR